MKYLFTGALAVGLLASTAALAYIHHPYHHWAVHHPFLAHHAWGHGMRWGGHWRDSAFVDWRLHHFRDPGRYHWVFSDGQYLLVDDGGVVIDVGVP